MPRACPSRPLLGLGVLALGVLALPPRAHAQEPPPAQAPGGAPGTPEPEPEPIFTEAQRRFLTKLLSDEHQKLMLEMTPPPPGPPTSPPSKIEWRSEIFMKGMYTNDQSQGGLWLGSPNPQGDNYSGANGIAYELVLYLKAQVSDRVETGARIASRYGAQFADFFENGDKSPNGIDATGESLGMDHAAYMQLRGIYVRLLPPLPGVDSVLVGSSDLAMWNAWTIGKIRYIDRDNAKGLFANGHIGKFEWLAARVSLPKLFASAGFNTGQADPIIQNPFWTRDASYALKLDSQLSDTSKVTFIGTYLLDEEADLNDPDTLGSINVIDKKDGVVATVPRYQNVNATGEWQWNPKSWFSGNLLAGLSYSRPDLKYVFDSVDGNQGISPIPLKTVTGYAVKARGELLDPFGIGLDLRAEYFNIGSDWVATFGARRETDVLLTDGFLDGQVPTLNIANEFMDWTEPFYEPIIGWHGITLLPRYVHGGLELEGEGTFITYNTNEQNRCTHKGSVGCKQAGSPIGPYPDFLFTDGMTDTDFYTYANTNDRGRDPRSVYRENQDRRTFIFLVRAGYLWNIRGGLRWDNKVKLIYDRDLRNTSTPDDDYSGKLWTVQTRLGIQWNDELNFGAGVKIDVWDEDRRSGTLLGMTANYSDYVTTKEKVFLDLKYLLGGATIGYRLEWIDKDVDVSSSQTHVHDDRLSFSYRNVVRSIGTLFVPF
jgi:hypothetical protein